jgi:sensor c-di-GMP phosphodiesterase-like protein
MIMAITAGVVGGIVAAIYIYNRTAEHEPTTKLRDAAEIIEQCHQKIREIENNIQQLKQPLPG